MPDLAIPSLQEVAQHFHNWRSLNGNKAYPTELWDASVEHTKRLHVNEVARAIGVSSHYLQAKIQQRQQPQSSPFIEVMLPKEKEQAEPPHIELQISGGNGVNMTMKFSGEIQELLPVVERLFCKGEVV